MEKIVLIPVKDEAWVLELSLACHSLWADKIIVADQNSSDNSREICGKFPKVILIENNDKNFNEADRRQILLNEARKQSSEALIFALDADEIVSADILKPEIIKAIEENAKKGLSISFSWIQILEGLQDYDASCLKKENKCFVYRDDKKSNFQKGFIHLSRVPEERLKNKIILRQPVILHLQKCDRERFAAKQRYYNLIEKISGKSPYSLKNDLIYSVNFLKEKKKKIPSEWLKEYKAAGIKMEIKKASYFFDKSSIDLINSFGAAKLKNLNIWDHNKWPDIKDPRNRLTKTWQKIKRKPGVALIFFMLLQVAKIITEKNKKV